MGNAGLVWQENHYVKTSFDSEKFKAEELKLFKDDRINNFKQIEPDCNTTFFKEDGSANLWYGKNVTGELEYFTDLALHPKTGKTLRPISKYMYVKFHKPAFLIKEKYLCLNNNEPIKSFNRLMKSLKPKKSPTFVEDFLSRVLGRWDS